jgi:hypothetical protein
MARLKLCFVQRVFFEQPVTSAFGRAPETGVFPALASGLYFGLRFRCLLGLALAFIFASHEAKYYTNDFPKGDTWCCYSIKA